MKTITAVRLAMAFATVVSVMSIAPASGAQEFMSHPGGRAGTWDFFLPITYVGSATLKGEGGSGADINSDVGFGLGYGYNFTDHFQLSGLFTWNSRSYDAIVYDPGTGLPERYSSWLDTSTLSLNGTFYFLKGHVAPFVSGGVGITHVDTNIPIGPPTGVCWWDPWWGLRCSRYIPTRTENDVTYNAGIGVRFQVSEGFSFQYSYGKAWIDFKKASGMPDFDMWRLDLLLHM